MAAHLARLIDVRLSVAGAPRQFLATAYRDLRTDEGASFYGRFRNDRRMFTGTIVENVVRAIILPSPEPP
ncbi:hypothetical protein BSFA1_84110 (plasmid) [Burkholderia sp. SFA1]|nr:hypothetical protein BSFA1_84110 [Burkholderia sp. SFA1]